MKTGTPRLLSILMLLAAITGATGAVVVLPSMWLFLTGAPAMADLETNPLAMAGLLVVAPLMLVAAPLAFALAVRRQHRVALPLGVIWWSLVVALTLAATLPVIDRVSPAAILIAAGIIAAGVGVIAYFWRLRTTFGVGIATSSSVLATPLTNRVTTNRAARRKGGPRRKGR